MRCIYRSASFNSHRNRSRGESEGQRAGGHALAGPDANFGYSSRLRHGMPGGDAVNFDGVAVCSEMTSPPSPRLGGQFCFGRAMQNWKTRRKLQTRLD
jgi:hypothetical protein